MSIDFWKNKLGLFSYDDLQIMYEKQFIKNVDKQQIQPASIDLTLGDVAYRMRASFLPGSNRSVREILKTEMKMHEFPLTGGAVLEKGGVYLIKLQQILNLPNDIQAIANPKSSTGRIDCFVRLITENGDVFDRVPKGYKGNLYAEISPNTFSLLVYPKYSLNQIRFFHQREVLTDEQLSSYPTKLTDSKKIADNSFILHVDLAGTKNGDPVGFRAKRYAGLIDISKVNYYKVKDFWEAIYPDERLVLDPNEFYILKSKENIQIDLNLAAEMIPIDPILGEFRSHYAGFFDPGFGVGFGVDQLGLNHFSSAVLEVRSHDIPFCLEDNQVIARLGFEKLSSMVKIGYGKDISSNYQGQGLRLSKHFKI